MAFEYRFVFVMQVLGETRLDWGLHEYGFIIELDEDVAIPAWSLDIVACVCAIDSSTHLFIDEQKWAPLVFRETSYC